MSLCLCLQTSTFRPRVVPAVKASRHHVSCREQLKEKKLLSLSCFPVRQLLFLQIYHALRALILQKKYQKKYEKYTVKFLILAVALHQLLRARCGRCGHAINSYQILINQRGRFRPDLKGLDDFDKTKTLTNPPLHVAVPRMTCEKLEAERWMFFHIQRIRCLSFRSCQRLNDKRFNDKRRCFKFQDVSETFRETQNPKLETQDFGIAIPRSLLTFKQQDDFDDFDDFLKILSGQKSISLPLILC